MKKILLKESEREFVIEALIIVSRLPIEGAFGDVNEITQLSSPETSKKASTATQSPKR